MLTLSPEIAVRLSALSEEEVAYASTDADGQKQPPVERHGHQHEEVGHAHLDHVEPRLEDVQGAAILLQYVAKKLSKLRSPEIKDCISSFHHHNNSEISE